MTRTTLLIALAFSLVADYASAQAISPLPYTADLVPIPEKQAPKQGDTDYCGPYIVYVPSTARDGYDFVMVEMKSKKMKGVDTSVIYVQSKRRIAVTIDDTKRAPELTIVQAGEATMRLSKKDFDAMTCWHPRGGGN